MAIENFGDAVGIANYVFGVLSGLVIAITVFIRLKASLDHHLEKRFLRGVGLIGLGWGLHQAYWLARRLLIANDYTEMGIWMFANAYLVTPFYVLIGVGALKCFSVVVIPNGNIPLRYMIAALVVWFSGFAAGVIAS